MAEGGRSWGRSALVLGFGSLVPLAGAVLALPASLAAFMSLWISRGRPERRDLRMRGWIGLGLTLLGLALAAGELFGFFAWKLKQAESQRVAVTRMRLRSIQDSMERYRASRGVYPDASGAPELESALVIGGVDAGALTDGWGRPFAVRSDPSGYTVRSSSPSVPPVEASAPVPVQAPPSAPSQALSASSAELTIPPAQPEPSPTR